MSDATKPTAQAKPTTTTTTKPVDSPKANPNVKPKEEPKPIELYDAENAETPPAAATETTAGAIYRAIYAVMGEVRYIQRKRPAAQGDGKGLGYAIVTERAVIELIRPAMLRHGLIMLPVRHKVESQDTQVFTGAGNRTSVVRNVKISALWNLVHVPSGESLEVHSMGEGSDHGDKAVPKALTIALKYALRQLFLIETGDDPDLTPSGAYSHSPEELHQANTSQQQQKPAQQQQKPQGNQNQNGQKKPANSKDLPAEEVYKKAVAAIPKAPDLGKLNEYIKYTQGRPFTKVQHEELGRLADVRRAELTPPEDLPDDPPEDIKQGSF